MELIRRPKIVAEIAQGFEGSLELSKLFIRAASSARANLVKFQMVYADDLATEDYEHYNLFKSIELSENEWGILKNFASERKIDLMVDLFGPKSLEVVSKIGIKYLKVHPTDINNFKLLNQIKKLSFSNLHIGIGGATFLEIKKCLDFFEPSKKITLVLGYQAYPTPNEHNQISRIQYLATQFPKFSFGFADHVVNNPNYSATLNAMAYALGADYFEKHLSFGNIVQMEDFESALQPDQFHQFVTELNLAIEAFGITKVRDDFGMSPKENTYRKNIRRKWVASTNLKVGSFIKESDIEFKRTKKEGGLEKELIIGKKLVLDIRKNEIITKEILV